MKTFKKLALMASIAITSAPAFALAQTTLPSPVIDSYASLIKKLEFFQAWAFGIIMTVSVFMVLYAAWLYLTSAGDSDKHEKAKGTLMWAILGLALAILAASIVPITKAVLGVTF